MRSSDELRDRIGLAGIRDFVRKRRLRWFGHVERMDVDNWVKKCRDLDVEGSRSRGRPRKTWDEVVRGDLKAKANHRDLAQDRVAWMKAII